jgi:hypothetical protein
MLNSKNSAGLTVDGYFGTLTETAVKKWQSEKSLTADGIVGPLTWMSLCGLPVCSVNNTYPAYGNTGNPYNPRAQFIRVALSACAPGYFTTSTYVGHSSYGNSIDIWPVGGGYRVNATGTLKANMDALAS